MLKRFKNWWNYSHAAFLLKGAFLAAAYASVIFAGLLTMNGAVHHIEDTARVDPEKKVVISVNLAGREVTLTFKTEEDAKIYFDSIAGVEN